MQLADGQLGPHNNTIPVGGPAPPPKSPQAAERGPGRPAREIDPTLFAEAQVTRQQQQDHDYSSSHSAQQMAQQKI